MPSLVEQVPRAGRLGNMQAIDRESYALARAPLDAHRDEIDVVDFNLAAFLCVATVEAPTHAAVMYPSECQGDQPATRRVGESKCQPACRSAQTHMKC